MAMAKALWTGHGFEPDVAVLAVYAWLGRRPPTLNRAMAYLGRVKRVPVLSVEMVAEIEHAYRRSKG